MENAITWAIIGVFSLFLVIGFLVGVIRGIKRSTLHIVFVIVSIVLSFLLTKTITNLVLGIKIPINGTTQTISEHIISFVESNFNISDFKTATDFVLAVPMAVASPFVFFALQIVLNGLLGIVYLIVARVSFGKKKEDFAKHKPYRAYGGIVGIVEGLFVLVLTFAPLTCLAKTAQEVLYEEQSSTASNVTIYETEENKLQTIGEIASSKIPKDVEKYIKLYNNSVLGKVTGAAGIDNVMYDYLSSCTINGERIIFRKDLVETAKTYNDFVYVYNAFTVKNYDISVKKFVSSLKGLTESGFFKTVICDTVRDAVVNFSTVKEDLNINLPQVAEDIITNMHDIFADKKFNAYEYIKHDINILLDTFENVVENKTLKDVATLEDTSLTGILNMVYKNTTSLSQNTKNLLKINLVADNFEIIVDAVSDKFAEKIENPDELEIKLNSSISKNDRENMVEKVYSIANNLKDINDTLIENDMSISNLIEGDTFTKLTEIEDIDTVFAKLGNTIDTARELELLVIPVTETHPTKTYVMDNILKCYDMELLGDSENYTDFFEKMTTPVKNAKELGLVDVVNGAELNVNTILDKVKAKPTILSETIVPFYGFKNTKIGEKTLKALVFDEVISSMTSTIDILDFSEYQLTENDTIVNWTMAFDGLGNTLAALHSGNAYGKTYAKFLIDGGDITTLEMEDIGTIIDIIKTNAYNEGNEIKGVLNDKFAEAVYIMTGDKLISTKDYSGLTRLGEGDDNKYVDIKNYLDVSGIEDYYTTDFEQKLVELQEAIDLAEAIEDSIGTKTFSSDPDGLVSAIRTGILNAGYKDSSNNITADAAAVFENLSKIASKNPDRTFVDISDLDTEEKKQTAREKIETEFDSNATEQSIAQSIEEILGL